MAFIDKALIQSIGAEVEKYHETYEEHSGVLTFELHDLTAVRKPGEKFSKLTLTLLERSYVIHANGELAEVDLADASGGRPGDVEYFIPAADRPTYKFIESYLEWRLPVLKVYAR